MGPRSGMEGVKSRPPPGFDSRNGQPVANRYTDWATGPTTAAAVSLKCVMTMALCCQFDQSSTKTDPLF